MHSVLIFKHFSKHASATGKMKIGVTLQLVHFNPVERRRKSYFRRTCKYMVQMLTSHVRHHQCHRGQKYYDRFLARVVQDTSRYNFLINEWSLSLTLGQSIVRVIQETSRYNFLINEWSLSLTLGMCPQENIPAYNMAVSTSTRNFPV